MWNKLIQNQIFKGGFGIKNVSILQGSAFWHSNDHWWQGFIGNALVHEFFNAKLLPLLVGIARAMQQNQVGIASPGFKKAWRQIQVIIDYSARDIAVEGTFQECAFSFFAGRDCARWNHGEGGRGSRWNPCGNDMSWRRSQGCY